jgi:POT family proton-dependent oligopeptide transporter
VLWLGCIFNSTIGTIPVVLLIIAYLFLEIGEICLGPVVFSLASKLSPKAIASTVMGVMYLSVSLGEYLSGHLGSFMAVPDSITDPVKMMPYFSAVFLKIVMGCVLIAFLVIALTPVLKKWMQEVK